MLSRLSALAVATALLACPLAAQQRQDEEYTKKIKEYLQDPRITTGGSPAGVEHGADPAQVPWPDRGHAG